MISVRPSYCLTRIGKVARLVDGAELARNPDVALGVGRAFHHLAVLVAVAPRRPDVAAALEDDQPVRLLVEPEPVQDVAVDDEVVALLVRQVAELGLEDAAALAHVDDLVAHRIPVPVLVVLVRAGKEHRHVLVEQERHPVERGAAALGQPRGAEVPVLERVIGIALVD